MNQWKDITTYNKGEQKIPRSWELILGNLRILVTRRNTFALDIWAWNCEQAGQSTFLSLNNKEIEGAKNEALICLFNKLQAEMKSIQSFFSDFHDKTEKE